MYYIEDARMTSAAIHIGAISPEKTQALGDELAAAALGALAARTITEAQASRFTEDCAAGFITGDNWGVLAEVLPRDRMTHNKKLRHERMVHSAAHGYLTTRQLREETSLLAGEGYIGQRRGMVITKDGLVGEYQASPTDKAHRGKFVPTVHALLPTPDGYAIKPDVATPPDFVKMQAPEITHIARAVEVTWASKGLPNVLSERRHDQLGTLDAAGDFVPWVTHLSKDHPIRSA